MPSRAQLELRAAAISVTAANYTNDSNLEQAVIYAEKNAGAGAAVAASGTLTSDATAPSNNDTVTIGSKVYTFKTTLTGAANEVLIGASAAAALDNLKSAINGTAGAGSTYGTGTVAHTQVTAGTNTDTTQVVTASVTGVAGNSIATTETSSHLAWGAATLASGAEATEAVTTGHQESGGANI